MYSKIAFLILANVVLALAENKCDCSDSALEQSLQETNDIVEFLNRLSKTAPADEKYPAVLTGVITGSLGCQCENLRRKRRIMPKEDIPLSDKQHNSVEVRFPKGNCAKGYVRVNKRCTHAEMLED